MSSNSSNSEIFTLSRLFTVGIFFILVFLFYFLASPSDEDKKVRAIADNPSLSIPKDKDKIIGFKKKVTPIKSKDENLTTDSPSKEKSSDLEPTPEITSYYDVFYDVEPSVVSEKLSPKRNVSPIASFSYQQGTISKMKKGDKLTLPSLNGVPLEVVAISKRVSKSGNTIIMGELSDGASTSGDIIVMTEGAGTTFFSVYTKDGSYEGESRDGVGFFYSAKDMHNNMFDHSKNDGLHYSNREK